MTGLPANDFFWRIHSGLPREGPGDNQSTRRAYSLLRGLPAEPRILDIACGPGMQTIELARISNGWITALDTHQPFLVKLERRAAQAGVGDRIETLNASMTSIPFRGRSFDLIWCEGAMYIIGLDAGLRQWQHLLVPNGYIVATHPCWLKSDIPDEARANWATEGFDMTTIPENLSTIRNAGFTVEGDFVLPPSAWWDNYYAPMEAKLAILRDQYADDPAAARRIEEAQAEIDAYRKYPDVFGYVFLVMRQRVPRGQGAVWK